MIVLSMDKEERALQDAARWFDTVNKLPGVSVRLDGRILRQVTVLQGQGLAVLPGIDRRTVAAAGGQAILHRRRNDASCCITNQTPTPTTTITSKPISARQGEPDGSSLSFAMQPRPSSTAWHATSTPPTLVCGGFRLDIAHSPGDTAGWNEQPGGRRDRAWHFATHRRATAADVVQVRNSLQQQPRVGMPRGG